MLSEKYNFSQASIKKYIAMTDEEVELIKERKNYNFAIFLGDSSKILSF